MGEAIQLVAVVYVAIAQTIQLMTAWRQRSGGVTQAAASLRGEPPIPGDDARLVRAVGILRSIGCQVAERPEFGWYEVDHLDYAIPAVEGIHRPGELVRIAEVVRTAEIWRQLQPVLARETVYLDRDEPEPGKGAW